MSLSISEDTSQAVEPPCLPNTGKLKFRSFFIGTVNGNVIYSRYFENFETKFQAHSSTDEMLIVQAGTLYIDIKNARTLRLSDGNSYVVPAGVTYRLRAEKLTRVLVIRKSPG